MRSNGVTTRAEVLEPCVPTQGRVFNCTISSSSLTFGFDFDF